MVTRYQTIPMGASKRIQKTVKSSTDQVFAVYVMANSIRTFFVGITSDLHEAVTNHKSDHDPNSFTTRFELHDLIYYELYSTQNSARNRELKLRSLQKSEMLDLVAKMNPDGIDLFQKFQDGETPRVLDKERVAKKRKVKRKSSYTGTIYSIPFFHGSQD